MKRVTLIVLAVCLAVFSGSNLFAADTFDLTIPLP